MIGHSQGRRCVLPAGGVVRSGYLPQQHVACVRLDAFLSLRYTQGMPSCCLHRTTMLIHFRHAKERLARAIWTISRCASSSYKAAMRRMILSGTLGSLSRRSATLGQARLSSNGSVRVTVQAKYALRRDPSHPPTFRASSLVAASRTMLGLSARSGSTTTASTSRMRLRKRLKSRSSKRSMPAQRSH